MPLDLAPGEVHVWYADPFSVPYDDPRLLSLLSEPERERHARRSLEKPRREYLMTRALVRQTLSLYVDAPPSAWTFTAGEHGKPSVASPAFPYHFNVTHTDGLIALALARDAELGIDTEDLQRRAPLEIIDRFFAGPEARALWALPEAERGHRFFLLWTLKEAYLKACARGLSVPLSHFWLDLEGSSPRYRFAAELNEDESRWQAVAWRPTPHHQLALALPGRRPPVLCERWVRFP
jgi:4'-phosphopantetheinyl transferase